MMEKNLDLYEALKDKLGQGTARMLSDAVYRGDFATKADLQQFATKADLKATEVTLRSEMAQMEARLSRQMVQSMVPLWFGILANLGATAALVVAVVLRT
jgi:hypothetical protein